MAIQKKEFEQLVAYEFEQLIKDFDKLDVSSKEKPTYLEIIDKRHLEDVSTRTLAFFFDTEKEHGLGDVCLQALLAVYCSKLVPEDKYEVDTVLKTTSVDQEVHTSKFNDKNAGKQAQPSGQGRIDLLIETGSEIILIENKIKHHTRDNPFKLYSDCLKSEKYKNKKGCCILLVKDEPKNKPEDFIVITHFEWIKELKSRLPEVWIQADNKYLVFLMDYISAIERLDPENKGNKMNKEIIRLFQKHHKVLIKIEDQRDVDVNFIKIRFKT